MTATRDALEVEWIAMYFHSPAVSLQLLFIVSGTQSFIVGGILWAVHAAPVYSYVVQISDGVVVVVAAAVMITVYVMVGVGLLSDSVSSTTCKFTLDWFAESIRVFPRPGWTAVAVSVALSPVKILNRRHSTTTKNNNNPWNFDFPTETEHGVDEYRTVKWSILRCQLR